MKVNGLNWLVGAGILAVVAALVVILCVIRPGGPAKVEGDTLQQRIACIRSLAESRTAAAGQAIAAAATGDPHALVRQAAFMALARFAGPGHRATFEAGTKDPAPWAREMATEAMGRFNDNDAVRRLGELAATDPTGGVRSAAVRALARIATPPAVALLVQAVENNEYPPVRILALESLDSLLRGHGPDGRQPWASARWNRLKAEVERVRPLAQIDPIAEANRNGHERGGEHGGDQSKTRPVNPPPGR